MESLFKWCLRPARPLLDLWIFQHCMVLDYLLAKEKWVCGKLNYSNCCLKTDNGQVVKQITMAIRKLDRVAVQPRKSWEAEPSSGLPGALWIKCILLYMLCGVILLLLLPHLNH